MQPVSQNVQLHWPCFPIYVLRNLNFISRMACELCNRPVDARALYGMDASRLAYLSLKDAEKIVEMYPNHSEGYLRRAFAFYMSEQYSKALDACLEGIRWSLTRQELRVSPFFFSHL